MSEGAKNLRRQPRQDRSRGRVDDILAAAKALIGEKGLAAMAMRDVAKLSGMPLATVYHYFPNRSAVIAELYERFEGGTRQTLAATLGEVRDAAAILSAAERIADDYLDRLRQDPALQDILNAMQADKTLQNVDVAQTRRQAEMFCAATEGLLSPHHTESYRRSVHLLFLLAGGTARLALTFEREEGERLLADFKRLIRSQLLLFDI